MALALPWPGPGLLQPPFSLLISLVCAGVTHCAQKGHPVPTKHRCRGTQDGVEGNWLETLMTWTDWGSGEGRCRGRRGRVEAGAEGLAIHASTNEGLLKQSTQRGLFHPQGRSFCETEGLCPEDGKRRPQAEKLCEDRSQGGFHLALSGDKNS